jgi:dihydropteroate synthase
MLRVHDVREVTEALQVAAAVLGMREWATPHQL